MKYIRGRNPELSKVVLMCSLGELELLITAIDALAITTNNSFAEIRTCLIDARYGRMDSTKKHTNAPTTSELIRLRNDLFL